jgi:type I restriction enzyme S subunit
VSRHTVPQSRLAEFARPVRREVLIDPLGVYRTIGCHLYGGGVYGRETRTGTQIKASRMFAIEKDDFVINRIWAQKGSAGIVPESLAGAVVTQDFPVWVLDPRKAFPAYVGWYLKTHSFWEECRRHSHGTSGRERLSPKELPNVTFPLPSLKEQCRIVARIEELAALIEEARALRAKAREEAEALPNSKLASTFERLAKRDGTHKVGELILDAGYGTSTKCSYERVGGAVPVLRIPNVISEHISFNDMKYGVLGEAELRRVLVTEGDILVVRTCGSADLVGRCAVMPTVSEPTAFASYLIRLRCDTTVVSSDYLRLMLTHLRIDRKLFDLARTTAGQYNVSLGRLRTAEVPIPPISEQNHIVAYLDDLQAQMDELTALQDAAQAELDALLPSVLDRAFKGEL